MDAGSELEVFSPAKINWLLAITGLRDDGFHELVSLVSPLTFGDHIRISWCDSDGEDALYSDSDQIPLNADNLVLKAAALFKGSAQINGRFSFHIQKRIPIGAGLGGGSSNAAAALIGMNRLLGEPVDFFELSRMAAVIGSDCPLFLEDKSVIMRGRGEQIERLPELAQSWLSGRSILLFKPEFSISTAWAYGQMKGASGQHYVNSQEIEKKLSSWLDNVSIGTLPLFNNMQDVCFRKYLALPVMLDKLLSEYGLHAIMSGSGSACFAILENEVPLDSIRQTIWESWGEGAFVEKAEII